MSNIVNGNEKSQPQIHINPLSSTDNQDVIDKRITSISDMIQELKDAQDTTKGPIWYRGQANSSWKLEAGYDRLTNPKKETELVNKFRQNANLLIDQVPSESHDFGWMFLMQHYGVPTRLIDWTESPLVALYFAVEDRNPTNGDKDGALWFLYPQVLNSFSTQGTTYIPSFEDEWLNNYSVEQYDTGRDRGILPLAAIATRNNVRIQAQLGVFTISHRMKKPIEEIEDGTHCFKLIIPAECKLPLKQELRILGMTKFQIFPELASIGEMIKDDLV